MKEEFGYKNDMQIPRLDKIVLNIGCGAEASGTARRPNRPEDLTAIAGQQAVPPRPRSPSRASVSARACRWARR
jgi:large subunit ribosomal protein L5